MTQVINEDKQPTTKEEKIMTASTDTDLISCHSCGEPWNPVGLDIDPNSFGQDPHDNLTCCPNCLDILNNDPVDYVDQSVGDWAESIVLEPFAWAIAQRGNGIYRRS